MNTKAKLRGYLSSVPGQLGEKLYLSMKKREGGGGVKITMKVKWHLIEYKNMV